MSETIKSGESFDQPSEEERTLRIARALGADVVYPLVGGKPSFTNLLTGNIQVDRTKPIFLSKPPEGSEGECHADI